METSKLFEHPITRSGLISLSDQIHDILCEEIYAGRWKVGEKLPSMVTIAEQCGVSRMPVQQAIDRLGKEGYLLQKKRSGVFLASKMPEGREPVGTIGLILRSDPQDEKEVEFLAYEQLLVHRFIKKAEQLNYQTKVVYVGANQKLNELNQKGGTFGDEVVGILSFITFPRATERTLAADRIPLVFWCEPDHRCAPCISGDYEAAFYRLTLRVVREGHRQIAIIPCPGLKPYVRNCYLRGYRRALSDSGLEPKESLMDKACAVSRRDTAGLLTLLNEIPDETALVCMSLARVEQVINGLTVSGRRIPEDISVVGSNPPEEGLFNGQHLSGVRFSAEDEIDTCIQLLREQMIYRNWKIDTLMITPYMVEGDTLAPPPEK